MSTDRLPDLITVQLPSGIRFEATLLKWPVDGRPVYAVSLEQIENSDVKGPISYTLPNGVKVTETLQTGRLKKPENAI